MRHRPFLRRRQIAIQINALGDRRRSGKRWHPDKVRRIINDPVVAGKIPYDDERYLRGGRGKRAAKFEQKFFDGIHEPIISWEMWQKSQEIKRHNTWQNTRRGNGAMASRRYPLSGVLRCSCGCPMKAASISENGKYGQYACYRRRDFGTTEDGCSGPRVDIRKANRSVMEALSSILNDGDFLNRVHECVQKLLIESDDIENTQGPTTAEQLARTISDIDAWYSRHDAATVEFEREAAWNRIKQLSAHKLDLQRQLESEAPALPKPKVLINRKEIDDYFSNMAESVANSSDQGCGLVKLLIQHHGLKLSLVDEQSIHIALEFKPPGMNEMSSVSAAVPVETTIQIEKGAVDKWMKQHEGLHSCPICNQQIEIQRRHYWHGIPTYHQGCWASTLTAQRSNPDRARFYNGSEAAVVLGVSRTTFGRMFKAGKVVAVERRSNVLLFDKKSIDAMASQLRFS